MRRNKHRFSRTLLQSATLSLTVLTMSVEAALAFTSGSNGSDGALNITLATDGANFVFDPTVFVPPLDPEGDGVYHFTTITVGAGVTVRFTGRPSNRPVIWLATGAVQIAGTLDLNGEDGPDGLASVNGTRRPAEPGPGGFSGGLGGTSLAIDGQAGLGPGGAPAPTAGGPGNHGGGGAGYANPGSSNSSNAGGSAYGNSFLFPLLGGSGGAGGRGSQTYAGGQGGAGGGAMLIASSTSISVSGTIRANGGRAGNAPPQPDFSCASDPGNSGGGGSGGSIQLVAPTISGAGTLSATGGAEPIDNCTDGGAGSVGRIRLEAAQRLWTFTMTPSPTMATPAQVHLANAPLVRAVSITDTDGVHTVAPRPNGSFDIPDVTMNDAMPVTVQIAAEYVPLGTVVRLHVLSENGPDQTVNSTPLSGATSASSTAQVTLTILSQNSRAYLEATWAP